MYTIYKNSEVFKENLTLDEVLKEFGMKVEASFIDDYIESEVQEALKLQSGDEVINHLEKMIGKLRRAGVAYVDDVETSELLCGYDVTVLDPESICDMINDKTTDEWYVEG